MNRIILVLFFVFVTNVNSQELVWHNNVKEVVKKAKGKPVLMFFTGSDWCGWCTKMQNDVFNTKMFKEWVDINKVVLYELDFPKFKTLPKEIREINGYFNYKFQVRGFPTVFFVKFEENEKTKKTNIKILGRTGYPRQGLSNWMKQADLMIHK